MLILLFSITAGCKSYKTVALKPQLKLPSTFEGKTDTLNSTNIKLADFFSDANLLRLIDSGVAHNPDMQIALQRVEIAKAGLLYNRAALLPEVNGAASAGVDRFGKYTMNGVGNFDTNLSSNIKPDQNIPTSPTPDYFVGFRSSWEVDLWGKLAARKNAAYGRFLASSSGYKLAVTALTAQIAITYYELQALDYELNIVKKNIVLQDNALELVKIQKLGGRATELAVQQFEAQLAHTKGLQYSVSQEIVEAENELRLLTGNFENGILRDTTFSSAKIPALLTAGIPTQLLLNRPDIQQAELELTAYNADLKAARAEFFPSVNLSAYGGYNAFRGAVLFNPASAVYGILGGLTAPVLNRRRIKAEYNRTLAEGRQALYGYQKTVLTAYQEVMNGLKGMENYRQYFLLKQQEVNALNNAVGVANDLFLVGRASYLEVITAQRSVLDSELELANTRKNLLLNSVNLYRAVGGGWR